MNPFGWRLLRCRARGASLLGVLVALSLTLVVTLSSLRVMAMSNGVYLQAEQAVLMDDQAVYALDIVTRLLQQAGHLDPTQPAGIYPGRPSDGALAGYDDAQLAGGRVPTAGGMLGSDLLEVRLTGDTTGGILDCAGLPVPLTPVDDLAGVSQLYVAADPAGEPELRCRTRAGTQWSTQAIASGIAGFQLLYGLDSDRDGLPNDFVSATRLRALDAERAGGQPSAWTRVVAVHVALLLCSARQPAPGARRVIDLFGARYADLYGAGDPGVRILPAQQQTYRRYRRYDRVIFLRHSLEPGT